MIGHYLGISLTTPVQSDVLNFKTIVEPRLVVDSVFT